MVAPWRWLAGVVVAALAIASTADAAVYTFTSITGSGSSDVSGQLTVDVTDAGGGQVDFTFFNAVGIPASITGVFFDGDVLAGIDSLVESSGVDFDTTPAPANLPAGNSIGFDADFAADASVPNVPVNGINAATEFLTVRVDLSAASFADVLAALDDGSLRIGLQVQAIGEGGGGNSFVNAPVAVPEPGSLIAWILCTAGLGIVVRRRLTACAKFRIS